MNDNLPPQITDLLATPALADDGLLLREMQHRHANDVSIMVAAVRISAHRMGARSRHAAMLLDLAQKLQAIGDVNAILADTGSDGVEDLAPVLEMLGDAAGRRSAPNVRIEVRAQTVHVRSHVCRRLALIANELILNAVKHGHCDGRPEVVLVRLVDNGNGTFLSVDNEGPWKGWDRVGGKGVGLVDELVTRLGGDVLRCRTDRGVRTGLVFPSLAVALSEDPF